MRMLPSTYAQRHLSTRAPSNRPKTFRVHGPRACSVTAALGVPRTAQRPPRPPAGHKLRLPHMFDDTHQAMLQLDARVMDVQFLNKHTYYFRHPDDIFYILSKDGSLVSKSKRIAQSKEFLGSGIFSQLDYTKHTAMRQTLNPAFRKDYLKQMDKIFVVSACQLADMLTEAAAAAAAAHPGATSSTNRGLDMQRMFRLLTIDSIGLTSMRHDFRAMSSWQAQQGRGSEASGTSTSSNIARVEQMLQDLSAAFIWQSLVLPVPRSWLPGWGKYIAACKQLDSIIEEILSERRMPAGANSSSSSSDVGRSGSPANTTRSSSEQHDVVGYLLQAQQQQGNDAITDAMIGDEIKTMMFGGSDTSSFTLAVLAHYLAANPEVARRAAAEVAALLQDRGGDVSQLTAEDCSRLPLVTACVNETLRLAPAGPVITRTARQDFKLAGYHIAKGQDVVSHVYAMQRHPDIWPQPDAWLPERWLSDSAALGLAPKAKNAFLPFSSGARSCIGRNYAMLQMVLTAAVLLGRGIMFRVPQLGRPEDLRLVKGLTMYAEGGVWLTPVCMA